MSAKKNGGEEPKSPSEDDRREERTAALAAMWRDHTRKLLAADDEPPGEAADDEPPAEAAADSGAQVPEDRPVPEDSLVPEDSPAAPTPEPLPDARQDPPIAFPFEPTREPREKTAASVVSAGPADAAATDWFSEGGSFPGLPAFMQSGPETDDGIGGIGGIGPKRSRDGRRGRRNHAPIAVIAVSVFVASAAVAGAAYVSDLGFVAGLVNRGNLPELEVSDARGAEDGVVPLAISVHAAPGTELAEIIIAGVPAGAALSAGTEGATGRWILSPPTFDDQYLDNLTFTPAENYNGAVSLTVTVVARVGDERVERTADLTIVVDAVADAPNLRVRDVASPEDEPIALGIAATVADPQEQLVITIAGVPEGATISHGENSEAGIWTVAAGDLADLTLTPEVNYKGTFSLQVTAEATDQDDRAALSRTMDVSIQPVADAPDLEVATGPAREDEPIALEIAARLTDETETLRLRVAGLPDGTTLSAGEQQPDGTWNISPDDLAELAINPPANFNGALGFVVAATARDGADLTTSEIERTIDVAAVADRPFLAVAAVTGREDEAIELVIAANTVVAGERLLVTIADVPEGARLSAGTEVSSGRWTVEAGDLADLSLTPPANFSGPLVMSVTAASMDGPASAERSARLAMSVRPVADAPTLAVNAVSGPEDSQIPLAIGVTATDDTETLEVRVEAVPPGAALSAGSRDDAGVWTVPVTEVADLALLPAPNFSGSMALTVVASSQDGGDRAERRATLNLTATPVADAPEVTTGDVAGVEDQPHAIAIAAALADPSERLQVMLDGIPDGAVLSAGERAAGGHWAVAAGDLAGLELMPPQHFNGSFEIGVTAVAWDGEESAETRRSIQVTTAPAADPPVLTLADASGAEDAAIPLAIAVDVAGPTETATVVIENLPAGAALTAGTEGNDGSWTLARDELPDLALVPPENFSGSFKLSVVAETRDGDDRAAITAPLAVDVAAVADTPQLTLQDAAGLEDEPVRLVIVPVPGDVSEGLSVAVRGVPEGAVLSAGDHDGNGRWLLSLADLAGLTLNPPRDFYGEIALYVTATAADGDSSNTVGGALRASISGVVDLPDLAVEPAAGTEDNPVRLVIDAAAHDPGEALAVIVRGVPTGGQLSAGAADDAGDWTLAAGDLADLALTPPANFSGKLELEVLAIASAGEGQATSRATIGVDVGATADQPNLTVSAARGTEDRALALTINVAATDPSETLAVEITGVPTGATLTAGTADPADPAGRWSVPVADLDGLMINGPADFSGSLQLAVTAVSEDGTDRATVTAPLDLIFDPVADTPRLIVAAARGAEDTAIPITIASGLADPSEALQITVADVPAGASLTAGSRAGEGVWVVAPDELPGLALVPPANFSGGLTLQVTATTRDGEDRAAVTESIDVAVAPVADPPELSAVDAAGNEDSVVALIIDAAVADRSEDLSVEIAGLPDGAVLSAGSLTSAGTWSLTSADLEALSLTPPEHFSGIMELRAVAQSRDHQQTAEVERAFQVSVAPVADAPRLAVAATNGNEDQPLALAIKAAVADPSEVLTLAITDVPAGATLSAGVADGEGGYLLTGADLADLWLVPPENFSGQFALAVAATATDGSDAASAGARLDVSVAGVADAATIVVADGAGEEDVPVPLAIAASTEDPSEHLTVAVEGLPAGAVLSAGAADDDGLWQLAAADLGDLTLTPPADFSGEIPLTIAVSVSDGDDRLTTRRNLTLAIQPRADAPALRVSDALGIEDGIITLDIAAAVTDASEDLAVTIHGLPAGAELSAGGEGADGWVLAAEDLPGLALRLPENFNGTIDLVAAATATDGTDTAVLDLPLKVIVVPVADPPTLAVRTVLGGPGEAIALPATTADGAKNERVAAVVTGLVEGTTLSAGAAGDDGAWHLSDGDLADLTLTPPADFQGSFTVLFQITAIDGNDRKEIEQSVDVVVGGGVDNDGNVTVLLAEGPPVDAANTVADTADTVVDAVVDRVETVETVDRVALAPAYQGSQGALDVQEGQDQQDPLAALGAPARQVEPAPARQVEPAPEPAPAVESAPEPAPAATANTGLSATELADLTLRGDTMLQVGDIFAARLLFELAARDGFAAAAAGLGKTYDPLYFEEAAVVGAAADAETALNWYAIAKDGGDAEAEQRLARLREWMTQNAAPAAPAAPGSIGPGA